MYILPQFLEIETKKLLKIKLNKIITDITDDFIENLFVVNPDNKYQNIMLNLDKNIKEAAIQIIKETIEIVDNFIKISSDFYRIESKLELLETDVLSETYVSYFNDGERFRIVKPSRQLIPIIGDFISIASMDKSGYAVHYDLI